MTTAAKSMHRMIFLILILGFAGSASPEEDSRSLIPPTETRAAERATIVFDVDAPTTSRPMNWSHEVKAAGDYQIGGAWVEVDAVGDGVTLAIRAGGKEMKTVTAPAGSAVTRFETRLEGLRAGDVIEVAAVTK